MRWAKSLLAFGIAAGFSLDPAQAEWKPVERIETYAVSGKTGPELYAAIGRKGPKLGISRAIAVTNFKLTWRRDYQPRGGTCTLASAVPKLIITYTLPEPSVRLPEAMQHRWKVFRDGVAAHERVHGDFIKEMVRDIEAQTVGLSVPNDPGCRKIREEMTRRLSALSQRQRLLSREFDIKELGDGGNVHQLVLGLVNGG
jgi:predicted secreted Zn-dependent protease